jgi:type IV pilus assembly protein PilW
MMKSSKNMTEKNAFSMLGASFTRGFTLLELLVAVLIGSIVIAVVGSLFLANSNTFRAVDDSSRLQENGRFALQTISRIVRQAGFVPADVVQSPSVNTQNDAYPAGLAGVAGARFVAGTNGASAVNNFSDTLTLAFRPSLGGQIVDCSGTPRAGALITDTVPPVPPSTLPPIINTFYVAPGSVAGAGNSLWCDVTVDGGALTQNELIVGVDSFQVLYGVNSTIAGGPVGPTVTVAPDYYTSANNLTGNTFNAVLSIQVALVLRGAERSTLDKARTGNTINVFGAAYDGNVNGDSTGAIYPILPVDALRTFRVITSTINLRNRGAA